MNKFIILATFLAIAASVSYAMPMEEEDDEEIMAVLQELKAMESSNGNAKAQWGFFRRVVRAVRRVAQKVCNVINKYKWVCGYAEVQSDGNKDAEEQVCKYVPVAQTVCRILG